MNKINTTEKKSYLYNLLDLPLIYSFIQFLLRKSDTNYRLFSEYIQLEKETLVLDCGCGPGTHRKFMKSEDYIGIDINKKHILSAKNRFVKDQFIHEDLLNIEKIDLTKNIDAVVMIGILHHLDNDICKNLFINLHKKIADEGKIYTLDPVYLDNQSRISKYLVSKDKGNYVRTPESYKNLVGSKFKIEVSIISDFLRVPYDHYFMKIKKDV